MSKERKYLPTIEDLIDRFLTIPDKCETGISIAVSFPSQ